MSQSAEKRSDSSFAEGLPPASVDPAYESDVETIRKRDWAAAEVFIAWERLRVYYNMALIVIVVVKHFRGDAMDVLFLSTCALMANLCFCIGPVIEGYLACIGLRRTPARWVVFVGGTMFAMWIAFHLRPGHLITVEQFP